MTLKKILVKYLLLLIFFVFCYACGNGAARLPGIWASASLLLPSGKSWGLSFQEEGKRPVGNDSIEELASFHAYFAQDTEEKVLYLTFDCGYENGNTEPILDTLKDHHAPAAFFVVGNYLNSCPDLVRRMAAEGHTVGNHSYHHPDMTQLTSSEFSKELTDVSALYEEITGKPIDTYYRPPQGRYSEETLKQAEDLGYRTIFWSLAYVDWYEDDQPSREEAVNTLTSRIHPGAVVLLHNTSSTNASILDELLEKWEQMGYRFGTLDELTGRN